jgi:hypothetical protein
MPFCCACVLSAMLSGSWLNTLMALSAAAAVMVTAGVIIALISTAIATQQARRPPMPPRTLENPGFGLVTPCRIGTEPACRQGTKVTIRHWRTAPEAMSVVWFILSA